LDGPHGSLPVRVYHPSKRGPAEAGALTTFMVAASSSVRSINSTPPCGCSPR
jgi:hypothetical protein